MKPTPSSFQSPRRWRAGRVLCAALLAGALATPAAAQEAPGPELAAPPRISTTDAQLLTTFNGAGRDDPYLVLTLQHFSTWQYGSNFFFLDVSGGADVDPFKDQLGLYLEYAPVFSLGRLGVLPMPAGGALRDVGVTVQINGGKTPEGFPIERVFLEGIELAWAVPHFAVFNTQLLARQERGYDASWQLTWVYTLPFTLGRADGMVTGFLDVWRRTGHEALSNSTVVLAQPQVLFNLGKPEPNKSFLQFGVELEPSHDFPLREASSGWNLAVSPMVRWVC
jgi:hypothetical protein